MNNEYLHTLSNLVIKNFKSRYANTTLGFLWAVFTPLLVSLVVAFVFTYIAQATEGDFVPYVISGMLPWFCFAASLQESMDSLVRNTSLWKQFGIPLEFIPASCVIINFFNLLIGILVALVFFIKAPAGAEMFIFLMPIPLILHFIFTLGICFFVTALYVMYRDTAHFLNVFLLFWLWASPVFYSLDRFPPSIRQIFNFNIMIPFLNLYRSALYKCEIFTSRDFLSAVFLAFLSFICGYGFFIKQKGLVRKQL